MAGDWIKIEINTPDKPEVIALAAALRLDQDAVVGKLIRLWSWADLNSIDGDEIKITEQFIDRISRKKGFAVALRSVGWLAGKDGKLTFPDFTRHNGKTAKLRAETNRRVSSHRQKCNTKSVSNVTVEPYQKALPEKRREDIREREREEAAPEFSQNVTPFPSSPDADQPLRTLTNSLRIGWEASPVFSPDEEAAFQSNKAVLAAISSETWTAMQSYLLTKFPEGSGEWQPRQRIMFLKRPGDLAAPAASWMHKRPKPTPKPAPEPSSNEPDLSIEEQLAILKIKP